MKKYYIENVKVEDFTPSTISKVRVDAMLKNGWRFLSVNWNETARDVISRLASHKSIRYERLSHVKIYYVTTYVRGSYSEVLLYKTERII